MTPEDIESTPQENKASSNTFPGQNPNFYSNIGLPNVRGLTGKAKTARKLAKNTKKIYGIVSKARRIILVARTAIITIKTTAVAVAAIAGAIAAIGTTGVIIIVILFIIFIISILISFDKYNPFSSVNLQLANSGPIFAQTGDKINYIINVSYQGKAQDIVITNPIPDGTQYIGAPHGKYDPSTNTVTWSIASITASTSGSLISNINTTLSLVVSATKNNDYIINMPKGKILGEVLGETEYKPPFKKSGPQNAKMITPTVFKLNHVSSPSSIIKSNIISNCVVTKIGNPVVVPSLPPECQ